MVLADTGNEHNITLEHIDYLHRRLNVPLDVVKSDFTQRIANKRTYIEAHWEKDGVPRKHVDEALEVLVPTGVPFLDLCLWKGRFPSRKAQFCTQELKSRPLTAFMFGLMEEGYLIENWQGVRRDESQNRADALKIEPTAEGWLIRRPIAFWTADMVIRFLKRRGIELNPLYMMGMGRVGCMPCINCQKAELAEIARRFPDHIDKVREWERLVCLAAKRGWTTFFTDGALISDKPLPGWKFEPCRDQETGLMVDQWVEPGEEVYERCRIDQRMKWAMTTRGGKQYDLLKAGPAPICSSMYGLCE